MVLFLPCHSYFYDFCYHHPRKGHPHLKLLFAILSRGRGATTRVCLYHKPLLSTLCQQEEETFLPQTRNNHTTKHKRNPPPDCEEHISVEDRYHKTKPKEGGLSTSSSRKLGANYSGEERKQFCPSAVRCAFFNHSDVARLGNLWHHRDVSQLVARLMA